MNVPSFQSKDDEIKPVRYKSDEKEFERERVSQAQHERNRIRFFYNAIQEGYDFMSFDCGIRYYRTGNPVRF